MGDLASDHDAANELIIREYKRLQRYNPNHELLKYITNVNDEGFEYVKEKCEEFCNKFETEEDKKLDYIKVAKVLTSYFVALRNEADKIEGINKSSKKSIAKNSLESLSI